MAKAQKARPHIGYRELTCIHCWYVTEQLTIRIEERVYLWQCMRCMKRECRTILDMEPADELDRKPEDWTKKPS